MISDVFRHVFASLTAWRHARPAPAAPQKPLPEILFTPIIFANGRDDDAEGLRAFFENRPVILRGEVIQPGPSVLEGLNICLSAVAIQMIRDGVAVEWHGYPQMTGPSWARRVIVVDVSHGERRVLNRCTICFGLQVQP